MEPNNVEKEFRKKLQNREIKPTENSWDRLNAMLEVTQEHQPKSNNHWMYIAASFIGFLIIGYVFFSQTEELIDVKRNEVVTTDTIASPNEKTNTIIIQKIATTTETQQKKTVVSNKKAIISNLKPSNNPIEIIEKPQPTEEVVVTQNRDTVFVKNTNEIDLANIPLEKPTIKVNSQILLSEVDKELEFTFREKVINTIDKNYKKIKIALAKRNQK